MTAASSPRRPRRLPRWQALHLILPLLFVLSILVSACGTSGDGVPRTPGNYAVQQNSVRFDGERYQLFWADPNGSLHHLETRDLRLVRDPDRTYLEVPSGGGDPVLHVRQDESITVEGRDSQGAFSSPWFPFLLGATLGNTFGGRNGGQTVIINNPAPGERSYDASTPAYRYPPTGSFGRDDSLHGSVDSSKPQVPDYQKVQPAPYATTGQSSGTGGGVAASNKGSPSNAGTAASGKGGFASGSQSFSSSGQGGGVGAGSRGVLGGSGSPSVSKPSGGSGLTKPSPGKPSTGSKGLGGARAPSVGRR